MAPGRRLVRISLVLITYNCGLRTQTHLDFSSQDFCQPPPLTGKWVGVRLICRRSSHIRIVGKRLSLWICQNCSMKFPIHNIFIGIFKLSKINLITPEAFSFQKSISRLKFSEENRKVTLHIKTYTKESLIKNTLNSINKVSGSNNQASMNSKIQKP